MQVININDIEKKKRREDLLEIIDDLRKQIENGDVEEFVVASMDNEGEVQIHTVIKDLAGGIGMFEIGKSILLDQQKMMSIYDR